MKRRRRGQPVADPVTAITAIALAQRVRELEEKARQAAVLMYRARESRDRFKAKVRSLEAVVASERRRAASVIQEQAAKTATMRDDLVGVRRQLAATTEGQVLPEVVAGPDAGDDVAAKLRKRLAEGNTAYSKLMGVHEQLRATFDQLSYQSGALPEVYRAWDRLCLTLYQSTKGKPATEAEQKILTHWVTWRNRHLQQATSKAAVK